MMKHSILGLYVHDLYAYTNNDNCSSPYWVENHEKKTFATHYVGLVLIKLPLWLSEKESSCHYRHWKLSHDDIWWLSQVA